MRRLVLFRHAKAVPHGTTDDHARVLAPRGRAAAPAMGRWLHENAITPDLVICSTAARTRETWALAEPAFKPRPRTVFEGRIYESTAKEVLAVVRQTPESVWTLLLVGHNPGLQELAALLICGGDEAGSARIKAGFPTGAVAVLDLGAVPWEAAGPNEARLDVLVTPKTLGIDGE